MCASRAVCVLAGLIMLRACGPFAVAGEADVVALNGRVVLADGSPAAGAIVARQGANQSNTFETRADADGRFQIAARFENGVQLHVRTVDAAQQTTFFLDAPAVRAAGRTPRQIQLRPARALNVTVTSAGKPVANADVIATGLRFTARATTDGAGQAEVRIPSGDSLQGVAALHSSLGVGGKFFREGAEARDAYDIELLPPAPHEVHVVDDEGKPVKNFEFGVNPAVGDYEFKLVSSLPAARVRTDESGIAKIAWIPRDNLRIVSPEIWSDEWKPDALDTDAKAGVTTQKLRRKLPALGRLVVPQDVDPAGILISGIGFGSGDRLDLASARAAADGTFTMMVPAGHSYVLGILDNEWACDAWTGDLLADADPKRPQVELTMYPATPMAVRVSRGPDHQPQANTFIELETRRRFTFTKESGERGNALGGVSCWLVTGSDGVARVGVGRGQQKVRLSAGDWNE